jgi:hypothetical protein
MKKNDHVSQTRCMSAKRQENDASHNDLWCIQSIDMARLAISRLGS